MNLTPDFIQSFLFKPIFRREQLLTSPHSRVLFSRLFKNLHETPCTNRYTKLHIILRANDKVMNLNANRQLEPIGLKTKFDVLKMGIPSLSNAAKKYVAVYGKNKLHISIVNDSTSLAAKELISHSFAPLPVSFVTSSPGNGPTFRKQISLALKDSPNTLIAMCEDDYLLNEESLTIAFALFNSVPMLEGFTPHNHPNMIRLSIPTRIYKLLGRFYQHCPMTTCTFITGADLIQKYQRLFLRYNGSEENSINKVWAHHTCISPCCWTLAEHLHLNDLSPVQTLIPDDPHR